MKRLISLLLALLLVLSMSPAAYADMIYDPISAFRRQHEDEMVDIRRAFVVQRRVFVFETPKSDIFNATLLPGMVVGVYYTWTDKQGNEWGYIHEYESSAQGWIPMDCVKLHYDHTSFEQDYGDQFQYLDKQLYLDEAYRGKEIWLWDYPGSDTGHSCQSGSEADDVPAYNVCYYDAEGRRWVKIDQYKGFRNMWLCASDPTADFSSLYPDGAPLLGFPEKMPLPPQAVAGNSLSPMPMMIGFVVLSIVVTVVILLKKKKEEQT